jgi:hypothetical protein
MRFLALESEVKRATAPEDLLKKEAAQVWNLQKSGVVREIYFTKETREAVILLECGSLLDANECLASLPLVREGYIQFSIQEIVPYDGYERLFQ